MADPLRNDVEEGLRFLLHQLIENRLVQADLSGTLKALVETLVARGFLQPEEFERRRQRALDAATERLNERPLVRLGAAVDKYALEGLPVIDCASLLPVCQARCCKLSVCLSAQDLDERVLQWDYAQPYQIRRRPEDGYCVHSDAQSKRCAAYGQRPAICRTYDCRKDKRIWVDFEKRILQE
jgi:hypothetical protein